MLLVAALLGACAAPTGIERRSSSQDEGGADVAAAGDADAGAAPAPARALQPFANVLAAWQPSAALDGGGELAVARAFVEPGLRYDLGRSVRLSFTVGGALDDYDFGGGPGAFGGSAPWETIYALRLGLGLRWFAGDRWLVFAAPTVRWAAEEGASLSDSLHGGLIAAGAYRVNERLSIGPGFGVITQIEDSASVFPILAIRWQVADALVLETGRGLGATQGPGLSLAWTPAERWEALFGGRFDLLRFRLDDEGAAPGGVGEEQGLSLFASLTRGFWEDARLGVFAGVSLASTLTLEDAAGDELAEADLDPAPFVGFVLQL